MPRPRNTKRRVLGPYRDGREWRIVVIDGGRSDLTYPSESAAKRAKEKVEADWHRLDEVTIADAITKYQTHLERKGTKPISYTETVRRLRVFFPDQERTVNGLTKQMGVAYYDAFTVGRSVDYHRNTLAEARSFLRWCVEREWLKSNPLADVKGIGRRKKGKPQLTRDEAIKFDVQAQAMTVAGDMGALGSWMLLLMGLRQSEVWKRKVRDVDGNVTLLRISDAKTEAGNRLVEIPEVLRLHLARLIEGRPPMDLLFGVHTKAWLRAAVRRVCTKAGVPPVTPHGLRGTHASLAARGGATAHTVAAQLGHESTATTLGHYTSSSAAQSATQAAALKILNGGKK
jgi:integrase